MGTFRADDGTELAYRVRGEGTPLVCVPGGPMQESSYLGDLGGLSARRRLVLVGSGPEMARLKRLPGAARWAEFRGTVPREEVRDLLCRCRALLFPGVEDFGIAMAEAQATATPVIALGSGGAAEIVTHGETGLLYDRPDPDSLAEAIAAFERFEATGELSPSRIRDNALRFARSTFPSRFTAALGGCL